MGYGKTIGAALGTAITLKVIDKHIIEPLNKKKKKKVKKEIFDL